MAEIIHLFHDSKGDATACVGKLLFDGVMHGIRFIAVQTSNNFVIHHFTHNSDGNPLLSSKFVVVFENISQCDEYINRIINEKKGV